MYPVVVHVLCRAQDGIITLSRRIELPFPPSPGLELEGLTSHAEPTELIQRTVWSLPQHCFYAELEDWHSDDETLDEMIEYFGPGWGPHELSLSLLREEG
jgi:hypothetical protein